MTASSVWLFAGASLLIALSPGPNVMFVVAHGLRSGIETAARAILGLALAPFIYLAVTVAGLSVILNTWPGFFATLRVAGACYLVYLGVRMLWSLQVRSSLSESQVTSSSSPVLQGFITSLSNPKTLLYWSAFLPQFIDQARSLSPQVAMLGILGIAIEVAVLLGYASLAARTRRHVAAPRFARLVDGFAGSLFVGVGVYFALGDDT